MPLVKDTLPGEGLLRGRAVPVRAIQTPKARLEQGEVPAALRAASGAVRWSTGSSLGAENPDKCHQWPSLHSEVAQRAQV